MKLLEEVKHIFGVPGLAYVVSTNIDQLQNSIRAAYGADFNGRRYLRRLFHKEYALPEPDVAKLVEFSLKKVSFIEQAKIVTGLPRIDDMNAGVAWSLVARSMFPTDIRVQLQALDLLSEVIGSMPKMCRTHFLWLSYLVALYVVDRDSLLKIVKDEIGPDSRTFLAGTMRQNSSFEIKIYDDEPFRRNARIVTIHLLDLLLVYLKLSKTEPSELYNLAYGDRRLEYTESLVSEVVDDLQRLGEQRNLNPLKGYASLVFNAGRLTV